MKLSNLVLSVIMAASIESCDPREKQEQCTPEVAKLRAQTSEHCRWLLSRADNSFNRAEALFNDCKIASSGLERAFFAIDALENMHCGDHFGADDMRSFDSLRYRAPEATHKLRIRCKH